MLSIYSKWMRRVVPVIAAITLMLGQYTIASASDTTEAEVTVQGAVITNPNSDERLNLRAGPSTTSGSLGRYYNGVYVEVLGMDGDWAKVRIGGPPAQYATGYMLASYLTIGVSPEAIPSGMTKAATRKASSKAPELRDSPKTGSKVIATFGEDIAVIVLGEVGDYSHIFIAGQYGYMNRNFLKATSSTPYQPISPGVLQSFTFAIVNNNGAEKGTPLVSSPYVESPVLEIIPNGTTVRIDAETGAWTQVAHNNLAGFTLTMDLLPDAAAVNPVAISKLNYLDKKSEHPLDLYAFPSPDAAKLDTYYTNGSIHMTVLGRAGTFWRVEMDEGKVGYILPNAESFQFGTNDKDDGRQYGIIIVPDPTTRLNVRASASTSSTIIDKLYSADIVGILDSNSSPGWYKIGYGNAKTGYVQQSFISVVLRIGTDKAWVK